jgi:hypothetical protein
MIATAAAACRCCDASLLLLSERQVLPAHLRVVRRPLLRQRVEHVLPAFGFLLNEVVTDRVSGGCARRREVESI